MSNKSDNFVSANVSVSLGGGTSGPPEPPDTYFGVAEALLPGVKILAEASNSGTALPFLCAHVLECLLKSYLCRDGSDSSVKAVKGSSIRHNLVDLWGTAKTEGLPIPSTPPDWVSNLGELHKSPYYLRYSTGVHAIVTPGREPMVSELIELLALVRSNL